MDSSRLWRLCLASLSLGLVATAAVTRPGPAWAQTAQQLSPGQAVRLAVPGVALVPVADGRLASYGTESDVSAVAFTDQAGAGSEAVTAAPGAQLVVLHVVTSERPADTDATVMANETPSLSVTSGKLTAPLQLQVQQDYPTPDDAYFAAAVPVGGPAVLTLSEAGLLPQSLDLRTGHRVGTAPSVLYRAAQTPEVIVQTGAVSSFSASAGPSGQASGQFGVATAYLSYWRPFSSTMASDPSQAFLDVEFARSQLSIPGYGPSDVGPAQPLPAGAVTFQLPDGHTVAASADLDPTQLSDIFSGDFYAQVPADITSVKVSVNLPSLPVQVASNDGTTTQNLVLQFPAPLSAQVTLPPPATFASPAAPARSAAGPASSSPSRRNGSSSGSGLLIALVVLAVAALAGIAAAGAWTRRRAFLLPARPVTWPPAELPPATALLLQRGPAAALPPASGRPADPVDPSGGSAPSPAGTGPALTVNVFGPLSVDGLVQPIRRRSVRRLLVALALTPERPLSADELAMIISDRPDREPNTQSVNSYASILRRSLPPGALPDAGAGGYRLDPTSVVVDWHAVAAVAGQPADSPGWAERADAALVLVRGRPLEGGSWEGIEPVVRTMAARVEDLARRLAALLLGSGDPAGAERAVTRGLAGAPGSVGLWQDRLDAAAGGSGYGLERAWVDARACLGADAGLLAAHYQKLRQGLQTDPAAAD